MTVSPVVFTLGFLSVLICTSELSLDFHGGGFLEGSVPRGLCGPSGRGLLCSYCSVTFRGAFLYVSFLIVCPLPHFFSAIIAFPCKEIPLCTFSNPVVSLGVSAASRSSVFPPGARCFLLLWLRGSLCAASSLWRFCSPLSSVVLSQTLCGFLFLLNSCSLFTRLLSHNRK